MQFDRDGNLLRAWGGSADPNFLTMRCVPPMCEWPTNEHGIFVDHNDNVWIAGNGGSDNQVLKFSKDGTFLLQIGKAGTSLGSNDTNGGVNGTPQLGRPADTEVDPVTNEAYIADGYGNKRVLVVDANTGLYKRHWGVMGTSPTIRRRVHTSLAWPLRSSSAIPCTASVSPTTAWCMCVIVSMTAFRYSRRTAPL